MQLESINLERAYSLIILNPTKFSEVSLLGLIINYLSQLCFLTCLRLELIWSDLIMFWYFLRIVKKWKSVISYFVKLKADTLLLTSLVKARFNLNIGYKDLGEKSKTIPTVSHGISAKDNLRF